MRLDVPGAVLAYDRTGSGPVVVQAHGLMSSRAADARYGLDFPDLPEQRTLVRYDARGHGESTGRAEPDDYTWTTLADDLLALVDEVTGPADGPVDAIGASMGAATILTAALRRPAAFGRLVLVIPPTAWESRAAQRETYEAGAAAVEQHGAGLFAAAASAMTPPILAELGVTMAPQVPDPLLPSVLRGAARSDLPAPEELAALPHPVLLLPWVDDPVHPVATAERLQQVLPDARTDLARSAADLDRWRERVIGFLG